MTIHETKQKLNQEVTMTNEMKNEINREIRAFNKTITTFTTNKEIWNKKVELSNKYGLKILGQYENENDNKYKSISTLRKGDDALYIVVAPKAVEIVDCNIEEVPLM